MTFGVSSYQLRIVMVISSYMLANTHLDWNQCSKVILICQESIDDLFLCPWDLRTLVYKILNAVVFIVQILVNSIYLWSGKEVIGN